MSSLLASAHAGGTFSDGANQSISPKEETGKLQVSVDTADPTPSVKPSSGEKLEEWENVGDKAVHKNWENDEWEEPLATSSTPSKRKDRRKKKKKLDDDRTADVKETVATAARPESDIAEEPVTMKNVAALQSNQEFLYKLKVFREYTDNIKPRQINSIKAPASAELLLATILQAFGSISRII